MSQKSIQNDDAFTAIQHLDKLTRKTYREISSLKTGAIAVPSEFEARRVMVKRWLRVNRAIQEEIGRLEKIWSDQAE